MAPPDKPNALGLVVIMVLTMATQVFIKRVVGLSPSFQHQIETDTRLDAQRISDLTEISKRVDRYWARHRSMPTLLSDLAIESSDELNWHDPKTASPYIYRVKGGNTYELCAEFDRSTGGSPQFAAGHFWDHSWGLQCAQAVVRVSR